MIFSIQASEDHPIARRLGDSIGKRKLQIGYRDLRRVTGGLIPTAAHRMQFGIGEFSVIEL